MGTSQFLQAKSPYVASFPANLYDYHKSSKHIALLLTGIHQSCDEPCAILCLEQNDFFLVCPGPKSVGCRGTCWFGYHRAQPIGYVVAWTYRTLPLPTVVNEMGWAIPVFLPLGIGSNLSWNKGASTRPLEMFSHEEIYIYMWIK